MHVQLIPIDKQGRALDVSGRLDMHVKQVCKATAELYRTTGFVAPWIGYLAVHERKLVGACAFKSPPVKGEDVATVEIGFFTFPKFENQGIATEMVRELLTIAHAAQSPRQPRIVVVAQTEPEENASTAILRKFRFQFIDEHTDVDGELVWRWELEMPR
ncbi:MAG TPA: GNAT family N-acetyltransferase [Oxalicibacterium sp.]|uniref:GNAT family N-acetyltransferase n=1 Tax=Oxalicibacterium sp. TaxID=2766525 RepID=UPI002BC04C4B|nr:GNAT family N-acetyltransferase [Oxalicibacterium sp.]HWU98288.1 GNAT family N-acetyltransferase [Oxalicibacterium sp.]